MPYCLASKMQIADCSLGVVGEQAGVQWSQVADGEERVYCCESD